MDPVFMYWNKVNFKGDDDFKKFGVEFSDGDRLSGVLFQKENNYFITSLSTNIKIEKDLKKLEDYEKIKKSSKELNDVLKKGSDSLYENVILKIENVNDLQPVKTKRRLSTKTIEFLDESSKKKKKLLIYSPFKELKLYGLKFQKENDIFYKYNINLLADTKNNFFLEKKLFYNRHKIVEKIQKEFLYKNMIFMEKNGKLIVQPIDFVEYLALKIEASQGVHYFDIWKNNSVFNSSFYEILFGGYSENPKVKKPKIFQRGSDVDDFHPIAFNFGGTFKIKGGINFYITKELYDRKQSIFRKIPEIPKRIITPLELADLRKQLNDNKFTISEIYGFKNTKSYSIYPALRTVDFEIPDFMIKIEAKNKLKDDEKKIFEGSFFVLDNDYNQSKKTEKISKDNRIATIKNTFSEENQKFLEKDYIKLKKLADDINFKSLNVVYENFFLYDLDNYIIPSFTTELQTEFSIYGLVNFSNETRKENEKLNIISPKNYLRFNIIDNVIKNKLNFELTKVHTKKTFEITDKAIYNFGILKVEKGNIGQKRPAEKEVMDIIRIIGLQKTENLYLNPVHVNIKSESVIRKLMKKKTRYRFVLRSMIFSSNVTNETDTIFLLVDGLNDAKKIFINDTLESGIGVCYLTEVKSWNLIKGQSKRVQVVFDDTEKFAGQSKHFAFHFITGNLSDILKFSITLVDGTKKLIKFKQREENIPIINFDIEILKT